MKKDEEQVQRVQASASQVTLLCPVFRYHLYLILPALNLRIAPGRIVLSVYAPIRRADFQKDSSSVQGAAFFSCIEVNEVERSHMGT